MALVRPRRLRGVLAGLLFVMALAGCEWSSPATPTLAVVPSDLRVIDGDTISWRGERIRLVGYDTPEIFSPRCAAELQKGHAARRLLAGMIAGARSAGLVVSYERDRYGRALAVLVLDSADVGPRLVAAGLARPYGSGRRSSWCGA